MISDRVRVAATFIQRVLGLLATGGWKGGDGLLLKPCNGIHTFGLREPIDVVVLDREGIVLRIVNGMRPNRMLLPANRGKSTLELKAGLAKKCDVTVGCRITFED